MFNNFKDVQPIQDTDTAEEKVNGQSTLGGWLVGWLVG
jgi:hypothetical protein